MKRIDDEIQQLLKGHNGDIRQILTGFLPTDPHLAGAYFTHLREGRDNPAECRFVIRVGEQAQVGHHIFHMSLLKEAQTAGNAVGNMAAGQFHLDV